MKFSNSLKKFISAGIICTYIFTIAVTANAESKATYQTKTKWEATTQIETNTQLEVKTESALKTKTKVKFDTNSLEESFFNIFKEKEPVNMDCVALDDFIVDANKDFSMDIAFVSSMASNTNSLGYFAYDAHLTSIEDIKINKMEFMIFDSVKGLAEGTQQHIEHKFEKNVKIGFFICSKNGNQVNKFYSIKALNEGNFSHSAKYKDKINSDLFVSLGFEDTILDKSDKDYNDTIFMIDIDNCNFPNVPEIDEVDESDELDELDEDNLPIDENDTINNDSNEQIDNSCKPNDDNLNKHKHHNYCNHNNPAATTTTVSATPTAKETVKAVTTAKNSSLPKTGEEASNLPLVVGLVILFIGILSYLGIKFNLIKIKK